MDAKHKYEKLCIDLQGFSNEKRREIQDAFFELGYAWRDMGTNYDHLNASFYLTVPNAQEEPIGNLYFDNRRWTTDVGISESLAPYLISYDALMKKAYGGFGKSILQDRDVVILRSGFQLEVYKNLMIHMRHRGFNKYGFSSFSENTVVSLDHYDEELRNIQAPSSSGDIIKVYRDGVEVYNRKEKEEDGKAKRLAKIEELKRTIKELEDMS